MLASESVFSMMKAEFGAVIRSKSDMGQINEVLCNALCHSVVHVDTGARH